MSRIPVRTPCKARQSAADECAAAEKENHVNRLSRKVAAADTSLEHRTALITALRSPQRYSSTVKSNQPGVKTVQGLSERPSLPASLKQNDTSRTPGNRGKDLSDKTKTRTVAKAKSSMALRQHIAKARAELQKSAQKEIAEPNMIRSSRDRPKTADGLLIAPDSQIDPFAAITDPFNQARLWPKHDARLEQVLRIARSEGRLNIAGMCLQEIPSMIYDMYKPDPAHVIDFSQEQTPAWYEYQDLVYLNAADNELSVIDEAMFEIAGAISKINLQNNHLRRLPVGLGDLTLLTKLDLSSNQLDVAALSTIGRVSGLTDLNLARNKLSGPLPPSLANLTHLQNLDLSENEITSIADAFVKCDKLKTLRLRANKLETLHISHLAAHDQLEELDVSHNMLQSSFVDRTTTCSHLVCLDLSDNRLSALSLPGQSLSLPVLQSLSLAQNSLNNLEGILNLPELLSLDISGNRFSEWTLSEQMILFSEKLATLNISDNHFETIPTWLGRHSAICHLSWHGNPARMRGCYSTSTVEFMNFLRSQERRNVNTELKP